MYYPPSYYASAWGPAPLVSAPAYVTVGASSDSDVVRYGQAAENAAVIADPEIVVWLDLRDKIFGVADDLGVGDEVRVLYYGLSTGQRIGGALSTIGASVPIVSGSALLSIAGTISSIASLVGIVVGIVGLFSGDDEEEKQRNRVQSLVQHWTKRMSVDDLVHAEDANVQFLDYLSSVPSFVKVDFPNRDAARAASVKLSAFYAQLKTALSPDQLALFVSLANIGRWQGYLDGWNRMRRSSRDAIRQYSAADVGDLLQMQINAEKPRAAALAQKIASQGQRLAKIGPGYRGTHWLAWLGLLAGASALAWFFVPGFQPLSLRLLGAARSQLHRLPLLSKVV